MDAIEFRDRGSCRMGTAWFLRRAQYARCRDVNSHKRLQRVGLTTPVSRRTHYARMDAIGFRDVQNNHGVRGYARHRNVVSYERAQCVVWTLSSFATEPSVLWTSSVFSTEPSVGLTSSGFATCTVRTTPRRMFYERA